MSLHSLKSSCQRKVTWSLDVYIYKFMYGYVYFQWPLSKEAKKTIVLRDDFNIDFLNFYKSDHSNSLQTQILLPTRVCKNSKTLIDSIFCNISNALVKAEISRNISSSILDHLPRFFILPDFFSNYTN